jgi:ABC-2 type transport system ATP-binding protein
MPSESFVLDLSAPLEVAPQIPGFNLKLIDAMTLEVEIPRNVSLNQLFMHLSQENIYLNSMRNKTNRLEELFLQLVKKQD